MAEAERAAPDAVIAYSRDVRARFVALGVLALLASASLLLDVVTGPSSITAAAVLKGVFDPSSLSTAQQAIVWQVRLPYALMATLVGAALAYVAWNFFYTFPKNAAAAEPPPAEPQDGPEENRP